MFTCFGLMDSPSIGIFANNSWSIYVQLARPLPILQVLISFAVTFKKDVAVYDFVLFRKKNDENLAVLDSFS